MSASASSDVPAGGAPDFAERPRPHELIRRLGTVDALDGPAGKIVEKVQSVLTPGPVKDALSGRWLGHSLHPLLTDVPIGTWASALLLDVIGGRESERASRKLVAVGLLASAPTAWSGFSEWADSAIASDEVRRVGLVHAGLNTSATILFAASYVARRRGRRGRGKLLGLAGGSMLGAGGWLGGHLSFADGVGVDQTTFQQPPADWTPAMPDEDLREGEPACATVEGIPVLLVRQNGRIRALANTCCHRGGSLHKGELGDDTITCPLHASTFRLSDGSALGGPAAYPQPAYEVRVEAGTIEVRAGT